MTIPRARAAAAALAVLAVVHAVLAGQHYFLGSFDDDAGYVVVARALAHGAGLTRVLPPGNPLIASYPPGYAALLAPIALVDGNAFLAFRALSLLSLVALFPLVWYYLGRRGLSDPLRLAVLGLIALSPVLATFSTMVMAEAPFVALFVALLIAAERWERGSTAAGVATVLLAAAEIWVKEAAIGLVVGLVLWLLLRRQRAKAALLAAATVVLLSPIAISRHAAHVPLLGGRYSIEFGNAFAGGIVHRLTAGAAHALSTYANLVFPQTIVPTSTSPLPTVGPAAALLGTLGTTTTALVIVGFVVWVRRHRDASCVMVPAYLLETLVYPFINERRLVLVLPVILAWYVVGAWWVIQAATEAGRRLAARRGRRLPAATVSRVAAWTSAAVAVAILAPQLPRDYLFAVGQSSSRPQGSAYMAMLRKLGGPSDVVETDYVWTTNLFTGHRTGNTAYFNTVDYCYSPSMFVGLDVDRAGFVLSGQLASLPTVGSPCLLQIISAAPAAVRLLRTTRDNTSVFELIGPGTPHPNLVDLTAHATVAAPQLRIVPSLPQAPGDAPGTYVEAPAGNGAVTFSWSWAAPTPVVQVSVGAAGSEEGSTTGVDVELRTAGGRWLRVASAGGAVGEGGKTPFLLVSPPGAPRATALRVTVRGTGTLSAVDVHALGQA